MAYNYEAHKPIKLRDQHDAEWGDRSEGIFKGCNIYVNAVTHGGNDAFELHIKQHGGYVVAKDCPAVTHRVAANLADVKNAKLGEHSKPYVKPDWVWDCVRENRLLDTRPYSLLGMPPEAAVMSKFMAKRPREHESRALLANLHAALEEQEGGEEHEHERGQEEEQGQEERQEQGHGQEEEQEQEEEKGLFWETWQQGETARLARLAREQEDADLAYARQIAAMPPTQLPPTPPRPRQPTPPRATNKRKATPPRATNKRQLTPPRPPTNKPAIPPYFQGVLTQSDANPYYEDLSQGTRDQLPKADLMNLPTRKHLKTSPPKKKKALPPAPPKEMPMFRLGSCGVAQCGAALLSFMRRSKIPGPLHTALIVELLATNIEGGRLADVKALLRLVRDGALEHPKKWTKQAEIVLQLAQHMIMETYGSHLAIESLRDRTYQQRGPGTPSSPFR